MLNLREYRMLERRLEHQQGVAIFWSKTSNTLKNRSNSLSDVNVQGVSYAFNNVSDVPVAEGRYFTHRKWKAAATWP